jgi:hypothetical protein
MIKAMDNEYHFLTRWRVKASAEEVYDILSQPEEYPRWWPSVYLSVRQTTARRVRLVTRGRLPYTLRWEATTTEAQPPNRWTIRATGDFEGRGVWSIVQDGEYADITFDWKISAVKPLLQYLSFALKPLFEANHRWAMEQGRQALLLELARARASNVEQMNAVPKPPERRPLWSREIAAGAAMAVGLVAGLWKTRRA